MGQESELRLRAGATEAAFLPGLGMLGVSLRQDDVEVLALPGGLDGYRAGHVTGLPLLAPWANRLSGRKYEIAGVAVDLAGVDLHDDGAGLPIHGTMTAQHGWEVQATTESSLRARFDYGARPDLLRAFPFPHELVLDIDVADRRLRVATTIRPTADRRVPVSFGWHPYFALPASRDEILLRMPACEHRLVDPRGLPTGASEPQPAEARPLGDRAFDDLYALGDDRRLALEGGGRSVVVEMEEGYPFAQVYSPAGASFGCLEAMTAPTNALVTGGCTLVNPGDEFTARFSVTLGDQELTAGPG
jgi:galactose mutarotase-like enzyme